MIHDSCKAPAAHYYTWSEVRFWIWALVSHAISHLFTTPRYLILNQSDQNTHAVAERNSSPILYTRGFGQLVKSQGFNEWQEWIIFLVPTRYTAHDPRDNSLILDFLPHAVLFLCSVEIAQLRNPLAWYYRLNLSQNTKRKKLCKGRDVIKSKLKWNRRCGVRLRLPVPMAISAAEVSPLLVGRKHFLNRPRPLIMTV